MHRRQGFGDRRDKDAGQVSDRSQRVELVSQCEETRSRTARLVDLVALVCLTDGLSIQVLEDLSLMLPRKESFWNPSSLLAQRR